MTHYHQLLPEAAMKDEPVMLGATVLAVVGSVLTLLVAFGVALSQDQQAAIIGLFTASIPLVAFFVRRKVTPAP